MTNRLSTRLSEVWLSVERVARAEGVVRIGASDLTIAHNALFDDWIEHGHEASMRYLSRSAGVRRDPAARFPWAKSAIVILVPYSSTRP
ncbi:MAG TPA: hypothetical protein VNN08_17565, partial [Thermoanaerobaculia bacterium]|nr:hypothetical protein [Thermoanaerobaculia bacterium]